MKDGKGRKELSTITQVVKQLTRQADVRKTLHNGFHVSPQIRSTDLGASCYDPELEAFEGCAQPMIHEEALNPMDYSLIKSLYASKKRRRNDGHSPYIGYMYGRRQFSCLDYSLTNLDREVRKYITSHFQAGDKLL